MSDWYGLIINGDVVDVMQASQPPAASAFNYCAPNGDYSGCTVAPIQIKRRTEKPVSVTLKLASETIERADRYVERWSDPTGEERTTRADILRMALREGLNRFEMADARDARREAKKRAS